MHVTSWIRTAVGLILLAGLIVTGLFIWPRVHAREPYERGLASLAAGDLDAAIDAMNEAIERYPKFASAFHARGVAHRQRWEQSNRRNDDLAQAGADLDRAVALDGFDASVLSSRSVLHISLGRWREAIDDANRAIEVDESFGEAFHNRAVAHAASGEFQAALEDYDRAIALDHREAETFRGRADALVYLSRSLEAAPDYEMALAIAPPDWWEAAEVRENLNRIYALARSKQNMQQPAEVDVTTPAAQQPQ